MSRLLINVALTGMVPTTADNPHVPVTPRAIAADVRRCYDAGASVFHIHARYPDERPAYEAHYYEEIICAIREMVSDPDIVICVTTSGRNHNTFECRSEVLGLEGACKPDMASLTLGSMNFPKQASVNSPEMIVALAQRMQERGIVPELEVFEMGMIDYSRYLLRKSILNRPLYYNLLLGSLGTMAATPLNLAMLVQALPEGATWAATGIGQFQFEVNALAITMGGHVRVGLEDGLYMDKKKTDPASNARLVERLVQVARSVGRTPAGSLEAREIIGLPRRTEAARVDVLREDATLVGAR